MFEHLFERPEGEAVTVRRYDDPVEVRRSTAEREADDEGGPAQFLWHGRVWKVSAVLAHWVETGAWWAAGATASADLLAERQLWRVEAGRGRDTGGVFDLALDPVAGRWQLVGCAD